MEIKEIPLAKLNVDLLNFRLGEFDTSREAYQAMIDEPGTNLVSLAQSIIKEGLSPVDPLIVGEDPDNSGSYIVFEGNRRITTLKLLQTPGLAVGTKVERDFAKLAKEYALNPIKKVAAAIAPDKDAALTWIERKHSFDEGRGIAPWGAEAKARLEAYRGKYRPSKAILEHLEKQKKLSPSMREKVGTRTTNIDRVFQMPYLRTTLGIEINRDGSVEFSSGDTARGNTLLLKMLKSLSALKVDEIKSKDQRRDFIDQFSADATLSDESDDTSTARPTGSKNLARKSAKSNPDRKSLAPTDRDHKLVVSDPRLRKLYKECRDLSTESFSHVAAVLMRVFLELSTEHYLIETKTPLPKRHQGKSWGTFGVSLKDKIESALARIDPNTTAKFKNARKGLSDPGYLHSIDELHQFVHALEAEIEGREVRIIWNRWHPFLEALFSDLADQTA
jgi:hypothetical protein